MNRRSWKKKNNSTDATFISCICPFVATRMTLMLLNGAAQHYFSFPMAVVGCFIRQECFGAFVFMRWRLQLNPSPGKPWVILKQPVLTWRQFVSTLFLHFCEWLIARREGRGLMPLCSTPIALDSSARSHGMWPNVALLPWLTSLDMEVRRAVGALERQRQHKQQVPP